MPDDVDTQANEEPNDDGKGSEESGGTDSHQLTPEQQAQLNKIAGAARAEGRTAGEKKATQELLESLGFEDLDAAKAYVAAKKEADDADLKESEKLAKELERERKRAEQATAKAEEVEKTAFNALVKAEVLYTIATSDDIKVLDSARDDILMFLSAGYIGEDGIHLDENGKVVGVADALTKLIKAKPYLAASASTHEEEETPDTDTRHSTKKGGEKGKKAASEQESPFSAARFTPKF